MYYSFPNQVFSVCGWNLNSSLIIALHFGLRSDRIIYMKVWQPYLDKRNLRNAVIILHSALGGVAPAEQK